MFGCLFICQWETMALDSMVFRAWTWLVSWRDCAGCPWFVWGRVIQRTIWPVSYDWLVLCFFFFSRDSKWVFRILKCTCDILFHMISMLLFNYVCDIFEIVNFTGALHAETIRWVIIFRYSNICSWATDTCNLIVLLVEFQTVAPLWKSC